LGDECRDDPRVVVALVDRRICGEAVEVTAAFDVVEPGSLASREDDVERVVVVRGESSFEIDAGAAVERRFHGANGGPGGGPRSDPTSASRSVLAKRARLEEKARRMVRIEGPSAFDRLDELVRRLAADHG